MNELNRCLDALSDAWYLAYGARTTLGRARQLSREDADAFTRAAQAIDTATQLLAEIRDRRPSKEER